jgi:hypothetical protein
MMNMKTMFLALIVAGAVVVAGAAVYFVFLKDDKSDFDGLSISYFDEDGSRIKATSGFDLKGNTLTIDVTGMITEAGAIKQHQGGTAMELNILAFLNKITDADFEKDYAGSDFGKDSKFYYTVDTTFGVVTKDVKYDLWVMQPHPNGSITNGKAYGADGNTTPVLSSGFRGAVIWTQQWTDATETALQDMAWVYIPVTAGEYNYTFFGDNGKTYTLKIVVKNPLAAVG